MTPRPPGRHPRWSDSVEALARRFPLLVNSGYATITAGSAGLLLVLLTIAGRFLSAADYGRFSYAMALTTIIETIMDIGLGPVTVRAVARDRTTAGRLFRHVLGLKLVWVAIGLGLLAVVAPILRHDPLVIRLCYVMGLSSAVRSYLLTARGLLQGLARFDLEAVVVVADRLLLLSAGGAMLWAGYGLFGLALAFVGARVAMLFAVTLLLGRIVGPAVPQFDRRAWRDLQTAALPLGFFMIALNLYTYIDTVILGIIGTDSETGWYAASYRVYEGLMYAPAILSAVLTPRLSYLFAHDRPRHRHVMTRALLGSMFLGIVLGGIAVWGARPILVTLFGTAYAPAVQPLQILAAGALFVFGTWILHAAAISMNLDRHLLITTAVGLSANVILNLIFIPRWRISGAAWATVIAEAITVVLLGIEYTGGCHDLFQSPFFRLSLALLAVLAVPFRHELKKRILFVASCVFYAAWDYRYLALLLLVSVIDYYSAARIGKTDDHRKRRRWVTFSVVSNLSILAYFKYFNFFVGNLNGVLAWFGHAVPAIDILLPAGISFYTFKSMSYTIDVYRREIAPCPSLIDYATFVTFFPELIAGPIVRASIFLPQMTRRIGPGRDRLAAGGSLFLLGLTKKVVIADRLAVPVERVFSQPALFSGRALWLAAIGYSIQIYCDFSGYSDMAIGTAKMIGYDLPENFNMPYVASSITEFWRRWHMTLSAWLRDYLYIPLGGNRKGEGRTYVNLMVTMLLGGLWHGASWNFVLWGGLHGCALGLDRLYRARVGTRRRLPTGVGWVATVLFVVLCWIPFRAPHVGDTAEFLRGMFTLRRGAGFQTDAVFIALALVVPAHLIGLWLASAMRHEQPLLERLLHALSAELSSDPVSSWYVRLGTRTALGSFLVTLWVLLVLLSAETHTRPFIYFQF